MDWISFGTGLMAAAFAYALFSDSPADDEVLPALEEEEEESVVDDFAGRHVTLSCQTCRKLKKHREVQPNLYQCTKCKRHIDLRVSE